MRTSSALFACAASIAEVRSAPKSLAGTGIGLRISSHVNIRPPPPGLLALPGWFGAGIVTSRFGSATASGAYPAETASNSQMPGVMPIMLHSPLASVRVESVR